MLHLIYLIIVTVVHSAPTPNNPNNVQMGATIGSGVGALAGFAAGTFISGGNPLGGTGGAVPASALGAATGAAAGAAIDSVAKKSNDDVNQGAGGGAVL
jgi:outer membrane lipoprotein SlyB